MNKFSLFWIGIFIYLPTATASSQELTKEEARKMIAGNAVLSAGQNYVRRTTCSFDKEGDPMGCCGEIPIGRHQLNLNTEDLTRFLNRFEKVGLVKITPVNTQTGNVWQDLAAMGNNPMGATVNVELASGIDPNHLGTIMKRNPSTGEITNGQCFKFGKVQIVDVVRFDKIRGTGQDGISFDAYLIQGIYTLEPSYFESRFDPQIETRRKFQAVYKFDPFSKRWGLLVGQGVGVSEQFDARRFANALNGER
jgi:hypothetical protein